MRTIDRFINSITMYRLLLYGLALLALLSLVMSGLGWLSYPAWSLIGSALLLLGVCQISNLTLSKFLRVPANVESALITGLILFFIMPPIASQQDAIFLAATGLIAMITKYIFVLHKHHIFNPAAAAALIAGLMFGFDATWWVACLSMLPAVLLLGFLMVRKIREFTVFLVFFIICMATILVFGVFTMTTAVSLQSILDLLRQTLISWPVFFFGTIMLTEPLTSPATHRLRMVYAVLVGFIFGAPFHVGPFTSSPELALIIGNIFSAIASPQKRVFLRLKEKKQLSQDIYHFSFETDKPLKFASGQYMEWTLKHPNPDNRGNRRYFTIASTPKENHLAIGVKIDPLSSSFKRTLIGMNKGDTMVASRLAGDFTLPKNSDQKIVFIAGGIGITPFRSMIRHVMDEGKSPGITLFYCCFSPADFAYQDLFDEAQRLIGLKTVYVVTNPKSTPADWKGYTGYITPEMIQKEIPDYITRMFYLSGPSAMVDAYKKLLVGMGVAKKKIMTDYFPGF